MNIDLTNINYVISQLFVIFAVLSFGFSYLTKDKKKIMILVTMTSLFYGGEYLFLGAFAGVGVNIISIIRNIWFYINASKNKKNSVWVLGILSLALVILGIITYENIFSIIPIVATVLFTYSVWQDNNKVYRYMSVPMSIMWIVYNIICNSILGLIAESVMIVFEIIGIIKLYKKDDKDKILTEK